MSKTEDGITKQGLINKNGEEVIPVQYSSLRKLSDTMYMAGRDGLVGVVDVSGAECLPIEYSYAVVYNGLIYAQRPDKSWGVLDTTGNEVIPFGQYTFDKTNFGYENSKLAEAGLDGEQVIIDHTGSVIIPANTFLETKEIVYDRVIVRSSDGWGLVTAIND